MIQANEKALVLVLALADPLRLAILRRLLEGPASVGEIMAVTEAAQPRVSNRLALLRDSGMVHRHRLGRQAIYELQNPAVAELVEALISVAGAESQPLRPSAPLVKARTCYDHLAGKYGVALFAALVAVDALVYPAATTLGHIANKERPVLGPAAETVFHAFGVDLEQTARSHRQFAIACLDWTERRPHLGGALGAALWRIFLERGWLIRQPGTREVIVTADGRQGFRGALGARMDVVE